MRKKLIKLLLRINVVSVGLGFLIGCMLTDCIQSTYDIPQIYGAYEYGKLILAVEERPEKCPVCGWKFHYFYVVDDLQELINRYLGN